MHHCRMTNALVNPNEGGRAPLHDIPALVEFAAVARWQHVTRAAEELGVAQSTLSRRLRRLERSVGVALFAQRGRRLELTRAGQRLAAVVDAAIGDLERALADIRRSVDPDEGTVSLAFLSTLGVAVVPAILREFRLHHPRIGFQLTQDGHEAGLALLRAGQVDMCLTSPLPDEPDLVTVALHRQPLRLVVPEDHPLAPTSSVRLATAAGECFVGFKPGYGMRQITEDWCHRAGFAPRLAFEGEDVATVRGMVAAGLGVALLPATRSPAPGTVELEVLGLLPIRTIGLVAGRGPDLSAPARAFHSFLVSRGAPLVLEGVE